MRSTGNAYRSWNGRGRVCGKIGAVLWGAVLLLLVAAVLLLLRVYPVPNMPTGPSQAPEASQPAPAGGAEAPAADPGDMAQSQGEISVDYDTIRQLVLTQPAARQLQLLRSGDDFVKFVQHEIRHQALLSMAVDQGVKDSPRASFLSQRAANEVLRNLYINQHLSSRIDGDWPTEEQIRQVYEENPENYVLPRRVHLWQIFIPAPEGVSDKVLQRQKAAVQEIHSSLQSGAVSFVDAAARFSKHAQSRNRGGYMGLVEVRALRPQFRDALGDLEQDVVSEPVQDEDGFHILQRGDYREAYPLSLEEAQPVIRVQMRQELANRLRQRLVEEALAKRPYEIPGTEVRDWWQKLRDEALASVRDKAGEEVSSGEVAPGQEDGQQAGEMRGDGADNGAN